MTRSKRSLVAAFSPSWQPAAAVIGPSRALAVDLESQFLDLGSRLPAAGIRYRSDFLQPGKPDLDGPVMTSRMEELKEGVPSRRLE